MRSILAILILLFGIGLLSYRIEGQSADARLATTDWVRTVDGWEQPASWSSLATAKSPPALHPLVVAAAQVLLSLIALVAADAQSAPSHRRVDRRAERLGRLAGSSAVD